MGRFKLAKRFRFRAEAIARPQAEKPHLSSAPVTQREPSMPLPAPASHRCVLRGWPVHTQLSHKRLSASPLKGLSSIFLGCDSFVCKNRVTQREPGMADGHNRSRSSERKLAFICQGLAFAEVCLAVRERS